MNDQYAIVVARFYSEIADRLVAGAQRALSEAGAHAPDVYEVAGAYEVPQAALYAAQSGRYAGVVCLGCVIRGETNHYDYVCDHAARGIGQVGLTTGLPVSFGILTVDSVAQAEERAGGKVRDSGYDAGRVVIEMSQIRRNLLDAS